MKMCKYKAVQKRTISRKEQTEEVTELRNMIFALELCRESDEELWKQLIMLHLDDLKMLKDRETKNEIRRKLQYEL